VENGELCMRIHFICWFTGFVFYELAASRARSLFGEGGSVARPECGP
jgi:hypothetical protein